MNIKKYIYSVIALGAFALCSCDDMFNPAQENYRTEEDMTEESKYAHGLLIYGYDRLPYLTTTQTDIATDDAVTNVKTSGMLLMATGTWASDNDPMSRWNTCKDGIQYVNTFLKIVDDVNWAPSAESKQEMFKNRLKGEAYGLRAIFYYHLLQAHGGYADDGELYGVPLLTEPEDGSSDYNQPRAKFSDCMQQIIEDCDKAIALLPADYVDIKDTTALPQQYKNKGVEISNYNSVFGEKSKNLISGKIAEAVKAQAALLAASPAFRDKSGVTSQQAAQYSANVLTRINGLQGFDETGNTWYKNKTMLESTSEMPEILWREDRHNNNDQEKENYPPTLYGNGVVNPSQNLVDAFPMLSGLPISDPASGYDAQNPYANRDPRLEATVIYNGMSFKKSIILTGVNMPNDNDEYLDNFNFGSTSTRTGYYMKKLLRDDVSANSASPITKYHIYPRIRYTEIFLAYAEAANDAFGPSVDGLGVGFTAYDVIKAIRSRAGLGKDSNGNPLPQGDVTLEEAKNDKDKMTQLIRNERRLELCFENKRFWDLRRWMMPINEPVTGVKVEADPVDGHYIYNYVNVEDRVFDNSYQCYGPIPKEEVLKWSNLVQNKGWK